jgi:hypothetical protein
MQSPYLTVKEVAALFRKSPKWVYLRQAEIPGAFRVAGSIFFDREILESSLKERAAKMENGSRNGDRLLDSDSPAKQPSAGRAEAGSQRPGSNPRRDPKSECLHSSGRVRPPGTNASERMRQADRVRVAASDVSPREERVLRSAMRRTQRVSAARKSREGRAILGPGFGRSCYVWQGHA